MFNKFKGGVYPDDIIWSQEEAESCCNNISTLRNLGTHLQFQAISRNVLKICMHLKNQINFN